MEVPVKAPVIVPTASERRASFICGILPSSSVIPALLAVPTNVPIVSNISIIQNVMIRVIAVNQPIFINPAKSNLNRVVATISPKGGSQDALANEANGFVPKNTSSPIQYTTEATSIPIRTAAFLPFLARRTIVNRPTNIVITVRTIIPYSAPIPVAIVLGVNAPKKSLIT